MRIIRALGILSMGALLFLTACAAPAGSTANTPAANSAAMDMSPAPAQATGATFTTSNLIVTPDTAKPGDTVMVGVTVTNTGTQQGMYTVMVKDHDGTTLGTKDVTLAGGAKQDVTLQVSIKTAGTHMVMVDKLYHNLLIQNTAAGTPPAQTMPGMQTPTPPAQTTAPATATGFTVTALDTDPQMPDTGENITVSFKVTNSSGKSGTYHAEVKIDGTVVATKDITLGAMETQAVNIPAKAPFKEGTFTLSVGDQSLKLLVMVM
jgi:acyl-CoA thioesterase FadM